MRKIGFILMVLAIAAAATAADALADPLSCRGGVISPGDRSIDVLAKCGDPDFRESHQEVQRDSVTNDKVYVTVDEWSYNFGPSRFMRIVVLKNAVVSEIRTGNYGYPAETNPVPGECGRQVVSIGDSKLDVLAKCGEPTIRDSHVEEERGTPEDPGRKVYITVEEWTYNLGPNRFIRILTFRNSRLTDIKTAGYGY